MNLSTARFSAIAWKEFIQLWRDKLTFAIVFALPIMELLLFGYAIRTDVRHIATVVVDYDRTAGSRDLAQSLQATGTFDIIASLDSRTEVGGWIRSGRAHVAVIIPPGYYADVAKGNPSQVQVILDGTDPQIVGSASSAVSGFFATRPDYSRALALRAPPVTVETVSYAPTTWYNPELKSVFFIVPGLMGVLLLMMMVMLTAMAVARERERGTLEALIASPVQRIELIVGKILPMVIIGYAQMSVILGMGYFIFDVPVRGSLLLLYTVSSVFIGANLALGMFLSTLVQNQQQAMQASFFIFLPNMLLSGFFFPFQAMPKLAQWIGEALPLTHFLRIVRGVVLREAGIEDIYRSVAALTVLMIGLVALAVLRFSKRLD